MSASFLVFFFCITKWFQGVSKYHKLQASDICHTCFEKHVVYTTRMRNFAFCLNVFFLCGALNYCLPSFHFLSKMIFFSCFCRHLLCDAATYLQIPNLNTLLGRRLRKSGLGLGDFCKPRYVCSSINLALLASFMLL